METQLHLAGNACKADTVKMWTIEPAQDVACLGNQIKRTPSSAQIVALERLQGSVNVTPGWETLLQITSHRYSRANLFSKEPGFVAIPIVSTLNI
jgi:hypothetical protein